MHDDFLKALRRDPPPQFARRLKQQLQAQETQAKRRTWWLRSMLFLVVGSAFASGMLVLERRASENPAAAETQPEGTAEKQAATGYRPRHLGPGFVPEGNDAGSDRFGDSPPTAATSAGGDLSAQSGQSTQSAAGAIANTPGPSASGGMIKSRPAAVIAVSSITEALMRKVLSRRTYKESEAPRFQVTAADAAFSGLCVPGNSRPFDLVVSSRRITHTEFMNCRDNGVTRILEAKLGYQALVLTTAKDSAPLKLSAGDMYLALARVIPDPAGLKQLIINPNITWDQVNSKLAYRPIAVLGPARDTPLRLLFETLLLEPGCKQQQTLETLRATDPDRGADLCHSLRTDRLYSEVEQTSSLIPQNLWSDPHSLVLVDYGFFLENHSQLGGSALEGPEPSYATFADGSYPLVRPVYLYADETRVNRTADVYDQLQELRFGLAAPNAFGFVRLEEIPNRYESWRRKAPLAESDLSNERSVPR